MIVRNFVFALVAALGVSSAFGQTTTTTSTHTSTLPLVGLGSTEAAEIDLVNSASNSTSGTAASCTGSVSFLNASGATIGTATTFTLAAGVATSVKLPFSTSGGTGVRTLIRGVVQTTTSTTNAPCSLQVTFATYDTATGATHSLITSEVASFGRK